jgi:flagellar biosynthesis/type III secretory pathway protein FliH
MTMDFDIAWFLLEPQSEYTIQEYCKEHNILGAENIKLRQMIIDILKWHETYTIHCIEETVTEDIRSRQESDDEKKYQEGWDDAKEEYENIDMHEIKQESYYEGYKEGYVEGFREGKNPFSLE